MTTNAGSPTWLADSSLLICFGAMPGGGKHLIAAYGHTVGVTPTVRWEMDRIANSDAKKPRGVAASAFSGRHASKVHNEPFEKRDEPERATARDHIARRQSASHPPAVLDTSAAGQSAGHAPWTGVEHAGEAETIAVAVRTGQDVLMTDQAGRVYAESRGIKVHSFTTGFSRLIGTMPPRQMHGLWRDVRANHYTGPEIVRGQNDFRPPPKAD